MLLFILLSELVQLLYYRMFSEAVVSFAADGPNYGCVFPRTKHSSVQCVVTYKRQRPRAVQIPSLTIVRMPLGSQTNTTTAHLAQVDVLFFDIPVRPVLARCGTQNFIEDCTAIRGLPTMLADNESCAKIFEVVWIP